MGLSKRIAAVCALVIIFAGAMVALQIGAEEWAALNTPESLPPVYETVLRETFTLEDFSYGSQSWRPYKTPLRISPVEDEGGDDWYLMFVRLNATPYGGNPYLGRCGAVEVRYSFENLAGTAAFHVIGLQYNPAKTKTNRQEGYGASAFYVRGTTMQPGPIKPTAEPLPATNNIFVIPAGTEVEPEDELLVSYFIGFDPLDGGLDSLHITDDLTNKKGGMTTTAQQEGTFYITHTGGTRIDDLLLLVAVNTPQWDGFAVTLESQFVSEA